MKVVHHKYNTNAIIKLSAILCNCITLILDMLFTRSRVLSVLCILSAQTEIKVRSSSALTHLF